MSTSYLYLAALLIGVIAGLRVLSALAAVSWAASLGAFHLGGSWLAFLGSPVAAVILTLAAIGELVTDQSPRTPSRKTPMQFGARIVSGALCGAALGVAAGSWPVGAGLGIIGAIFGTLGGFGFRSGLAHAFHRDRPAAFLEDAVAIVGAILIVSVLA